MRRLRVFLPFVVVFIGFTHNPRAQGRVVAPEGGFKRPAYRVVLRQNENWSGLKGRDRTSTGDFFDPIKFVPLSKSGKLWASFGGSARLRFESWENFGFGPTNDDEFLLSRLRLHGDFHFGKGLRLFVEGKGAFSTERDLPGGQRTLDNDELDLQQAFADLTLPLGDKSSLTTRAGRQILLFGNQRLVSPLPWGNALRAWDGVSTRLSLPGWVVTGFWTQFVPVRKYRFNKSDAQTAFYGVYTAGAFPDTGLGLDLYWLRLDRDDARERRNTAGGRLSGKILGTGFDFDLEGAYQFGDLGSVEIEAFMVAAQAGYTFVEFRGRPRIWIGFDYASGGTSSSGDVQTFDPLFPLGHAYLGFIDVVGRQNIIDLSAGVSVKLAQRLLLGVSSHFFWRADTKDALYNAGGGVVRAGSLANDRYVGAEIDTTAKFRLDRHTALLFGYSHFFTGDFVDNANPAANNDVDFLYFSVQYLF